MQLTVWRISLGCQYFLAQNAENEVIQLQLFNADVNVVTRRDYQPRNVSASVARHAFTRLKMHPSTFFASRVSTVEAQRKAPILWWNALDRRRLEPENLAAPVASRQTQSPGTPLLLLLLRQDKLRRYAARDFFHFYMSILIFYYRLEDTSRAYTKILCNKKMQNRND